MGDIAANGQYLRAQGTRTLHRLNMCTYNWNNKVAEGKVNLSNQEIHTIVSVWAHRDNEHMMTKRPNLTLLTQLGPSEAFPVTLLNVAALSEHLSKINKSQGVSTYHKPFNTLRFLPVPCCFISYMINCLALQMNMMCNMQSNNGRDPLPLSWWRCSVSKGHLSEAEVSAWIERWSLLTKPCCCSKIGLTSDDRIALCACVCLHGHMCVRELNRMLF